MAYANLREDGKYEVPVTPGEETVVIEGVQSKGTYQGIDGNRLLLGLVLSVNVKAGTPVGN